MEKGSYFVKVFLCVIGILGFIALAWFGCVYMMTQSQIEETYEELEQEWNSTNQSNVSIFGFSLGEELQPVLKARAPSYGNVIPYHEKIYKNKTYHTFSNFIKDCSLGAANRSFNLESRCISILKDDGSTYSTDDVERLSLISDPSDTLIEIDIMFNNDEDMLNFRDSLLKNYSKNLVSDRLLWFNKREEQFILRLKNNLVAFVKTDGRTLIVLIPEIGFKKKVSHRNKYFTTAFWQGWSERKEYKEFLMRKKNELEEQNNIKQQSYREAFN